MAKKTKNFAAKADFTVEMLPRNRKTQFFTIVRDRIPLLLKLSLVTLLFFIPTILATSYKTVVVYNFYKRFLLLFCNFPQKEDSKHRHPLSSYNNICSISSFSGITRSAPLRVVIREAAALAKRSISFKSFSSSPSSPCSST